MRSNDPQLMAQVMLNEQTGGKYQTQQHVGSYVAYVVDNHTNNPQIPLGTAKFSIQQFGADNAFPPAPFPGIFDPPIGTQCVVTFEGPFGNQPRIVSFTEWQSNMVTIGTTDPRGTTYYPQGYAPSVGDFWIDTST